MSIQVFPSFFNLPSISQEEESRELEQLDEEERRQLLQDLSGQQECPTESPELITRSMQMLQQAVDCIDTRKKLDYLRARNRCPALVEELFIGFLRCERFDAWAAAQRMVVYWRVRVEIFGADRAFLPMTLDGAMKEDKYLVQKGHCMILPNDVHGRPVVCINRRAFKVTSLTMDSVLRCLYYFLHCIAESRQGQQLGFVLIYSFTTLTPPFKIFNRVFKEKFIALICTFPAKLRTLHATARTTPFVSILWPIARRLVGSYVRPRCFLHSGEKENIRLGLEQYGLKREDLPLYIGGKLGPSYFAAWLDNRVRQESRLSYFVSEIDSFNMASVEAAPRDDAPQPMVPSESTVALSMDLDVEVLVQNRHVARNVIGQIEDAELKTRFRNVVYSRRKRRKQQERYNELQTELWALERENHRLRNEQYVLSNAVDKALRMLEWDDDYHQSY